MSAVCLDKPIRSPFAVYSKHGISDEAHYINQQVKTVQDELKNTVTMSGRLQLAYLALKDTINEFLTDNWDGYGAKALQISSLANADRFLNILPTTTNLPEVSVDPDGEIVLEWYKAPRQVFSMSVGTNGELVYAGLFGSNKANGTEYFEDEIPKAILDNLKRVYR